MNSRPITLRFGSGPVIQGGQEPISGVNHFEIDPGRGHKVPLHLLGLALRSSPWSTKTQVSWLPTARWTSAAATAESTPPDSPQIRCLSSTCCWIASTASSTMFAGVQSGVQPAMSYKNLFQHELTGLGMQHLRCHCTPAKPRPASSKARSVPQRCSPERGNPLAPQLPRRRGSSTLAATPAGRPARFRAR